MEKGERKVNEEIGQRERGNGRLKEGRYEKN